MKTTLRIFKNYKDNSYYIKNDDPRVMDLFGTDTLPAAFTINADEIVVQDKIKELNPDSLVIFDTSLTVR